MFKKEHFTPINIAFLIVIIAILIIMGRIFDVVMLFFTAFVLACSLNPIIDRLNKFIPRTFATLTVLVVSLSLTILLFVPLIVVALQKIANVFEFLPHNLEGILQFIHTKYSNLTFLQNVNPAEIQTQAANIGSKVISGSIHITKSILSGVTIILMIGVVVFYFTNDKEILKIRFLRIFPPELRKRAEEISEEVSTKVGGFVIATIMSSAVVGILTTLGLLLIRHDEPVFLGFITGAFDVVPVVGPTIAVILGLVATYENGNWGYMLLTLGIYLIAQWLQNQMLRPMIFGKFMDMHPLMIIFSILVGAKFYGAWGAIVAPAFASVAIVLFEELYLKQIEK